MRRLRPKKDTMNSFVGMHKADETLFANTEAFLDLMYKQSFIGLCKRTGSRLVVGSVSRSFSCNVLSLVMFPRQKNPVLTSYFCFTFSSCCFLIIVSSIFSIVRFFSRFFLASSITFAILKTSEMSLSTYSKSFLTESIISGLDLA